MRLPTSLRYLTALVFLLVLISAPRARGAANTASNTSSPSATWQFAPDGPTTLEVVRDGALVTKIATSAWGPDWKYFEYPGPARVDARAERSIAQSSPIPNTPGPVHLNLDYRVNQPSPSSVAVSYSLVSSDATDLIGLACVLRPAADAKITATLADGSTRDVNWHHAGAFKETVRQFTVTAAGGTFTLALSPARYCETDWDELRIWMVKKSIPGHQPVATTLTFTFPDSLRFYAKDTDAASTDITDDWFPYPVAMSGTPVDLSFLNRDAAGKFVAAGSHGFLKTQGDAFVFDDGTPARFWGVNLTASAALCPAPRAQQLADRLARLGVNLVRLHHLDSDWGPDILDLKSSDNTTQHLNPLNMDRLDRLIYELKLRGIYVLLDPWVGRGYRPGDDVPGSDKFRKGNFGLHPYIFFDPRMRELHKQFLKQFWTHENPYTHLAYKDDPAIALTECANEALFDLNPDGGPIADPYRTELIQLYRKWCFDHHDAPDPGDSIIRLNYPVQHQRFYQWVMDQFFQDIHRYLREDLGLRIPINYSNWYHWPWEIGANAGGDFMDSHHYYHGTRIGPSAALGGLWVANPLDNPDSPFAPISAMAILGKPATSSECGDNPPQTYRSSYYLGLAAIACLQGYDSLTPYAYSQAAEPAGILTQFEMESDPASVASLAAGALVYRRGDVSPGKQLAVMLLPPDEQYAMHWENNYEKAFDHTPEFRAASETHRLAVVYGDKLPPDIHADITMTPASALAWKNDGTQLLSDTKEVWRDWSLGIGLINTPRTQAAYGRLGASRDSVSTADATFAISTPFAVCSLSSLTADPIRTSSHLLLTTVARAENTGQTHNLSRTRIVNWGNAPVLAEPVVGSVSFATTATALVVRPLLPNGVPGPALPLQITNGRATITLSPASKTLFYDISIPK